MPSKRILTPTEVRRLAIASQALTGPHPTPDADGIMDVVRTLRCLQIDPIRAVEYTQRLVLWSRLGNYDPALLDQLLFDDWQLFEYWAHCASIVLTEDYPIHATRMRHHRLHDQQNNEWLAANQVMVDYIYDRLRSEGPLSSDQLEDRTVVPWRSSGWNDHRNVGLMFGVLWERGDVVIAGRKGRKRIWHLADLAMSAQKELPDLDEEQATELSISHALRALGVATPQQIKRHFTRHFYPHLEEGLERMVANGQVEPVQIIEDGKFWPGDWYIHTDQVPALEAIQRGEWQPRTTLLSPFDNLICDRARTEQIFNFHYRIEIYVPKAKRQYGYYVLPILHGDRLIGRIDSKMDRKTGCYEINEIYMEPDVECTPEINGTIEAAIESLAAFIGAGVLQCGGEIASPCFAAWTAATRPSPNFGEGPDKPQKGASPG